MSTREVTVHDAGRAHTNQRGEERAHVIAQESCCAAAWARHGQLDLCPRGKKKKRKEKPTGKPFND
eukprot:1140537-Pelagomonas_calceolata.AAC.7